MKKYQVVLMILVCLGCNEESEPLTGNAIITFTGNDIRSREISIYPESVFTVSDLVHTNPIIDRLTQNGQGEIFIENLNAANYTWYGNGSNIGFFQISAGQTKTYEFVLN